MSTHFFIPALRFHALTGFYDALMARLVKEDAFKRRLVAQAGLRPGHRVLDLGCGTGRLSLLLKQACPGAEVHALDADPKALDLARAKAREADTKIEFHEAFAQNLPFEKGAFDCVVSCLMFHHLPPTTKQEAMAQIRRVLKPGGEFHMADWGRALNWRQRIAFLFVRCLDGFETTRGHVDGILADYLLQAGFQEVSQTEAKSTAFGTIALYRSMNEPPGEPKAEEAATHCPRNTLVDSLKEPGERAGALPDVLIRAHQCDLHD